MPGEVGILGSMRRWYVWVSISVVLLGLLVWRTRPWEALATGADWQPLVVVVLLNLVVIAAWAVRSERLMAAVGHPIPVRALVPVVSFANTINNLTPASSGEALRAVILRRRHGVPYGRSTAVILVERLWAIWIMAISAGAAALGTLVPASSVRRRDRLDRGDRRDLRAGSRVPALGFRPAASVARVVEPRTAPGRPPPRRPSGGGRASPRCCGTSTRTRRDPRRAERRPELCFVHGGRVRRHRPCSSG